MPGRSGASSVSCSGCQVRIVSLSSYVGMLDGNMMLEAMRTSVKLTGTSFPTMLPTPPAILRMLVSKSLLSFFFASIWASTSFFCASSSSADSLAYEQREIRLCLLARSNGHSKLTFFLVVIAFCISFFLLFRPLSSKSTVLLLRCFLYSRLIHTYF